MDINELLRTAVASGASDLHLKVGSYPMMRVSGSLVVASEEKRLDKGDTEEMADKLFSADQREKFRRAQEVDLAYSLPGMGRFRCNVFQQRGTVGLVLRVIPTRIKTIDELGLPPVLKKIASEERGLVLVTGTTGSGKSTTLAAMIDYINSSRAAHIMTVEDPIEYLHRDHHSIVNQREVNVDTQSFSHALRSALRQDPDVILVGEMRDHETVETALLAAETGHLVFSTLHTLDATETVNRIIAVFPPHQQRQVRIQLASVLKGAVAQRLLPRADGVGRVPAVEVMITTGFIRDCIIDKDRTSQIHGALAAGTSQYGMQTFDQSIFSLYQQGLVTLDEALRWATNVDEFKLKVQGISTTADMAREEMARNVGGSPDITRFWGVTETGRTRFVPDDSILHPRAPLSLPRRPAPARTTRAVGGGAPGAAARSRASRRRSRRRDRAPARNAGARRRAGGAGLRAHGRHGKGTRTAARHARAARDGDRERDRRGGARRRVRRPGRADPHRARAAEEAPRPPAHRLGGRACPALSVPDAPGIQPRRERGRPQKARRQGTGRMNP